MLNENELRVRTLAESGDTAVVERFDRHHFPNGWAELPVDGVRGRVASPA